MKHSELLKLLYIHKESIDRAYREGSLESVAPELIEATLFVRINQRYKLNKNYVNFVDSVLNRVDYSIIFGNYENEYKDIVKSKRRYQENKEYTYIVTIHTHIESIYFKFINRDREIQVLLQRLENDTSLDIDILIEHATDILEKVSELIDANEKVGALFRDELRGLESSIDMLLESISIAILKYIENIDKYIKQLNHFLVQTKRRRIQNKQFMELANRILREDTQAIDEYLIQHAKFHYYTLTISQKNRIQFLAHERDYFKLSKELHHLLHEIKIPKIPKNLPLKIQEVGKLEIINIESIMRDLIGSKSEDVFLFVYGHQELQGYQGQTLLEESFKVYMQLIASSEVVFAQGYNHYGIRVARWV